VYISVDMEGVAGVTSVTQLDPGSHGYPDAQRLMTGEASAAVAGAFDGGADDVTVADSHGSMDNLVLEQLDPRARIVSGAPRAHSMVHGIGPHVDVALFVGYHAATGQLGVLSHTFCGSFSAVRLNGEPVSEAEINALYAATHGVPVGLVTGDDVICDWTREQLPHARTVAVKRSIGWTAADSLHPAAARDAIRDEAVRAVGESASYPPLEVPNDLVLEVQSKTPTVADLCALVPGAQRVDVCIVRRPMSDPAELLDVLGVWCRLASASS
jgi:D-amino peptidase